jgi:hypothetical protein
VAPLSPISRVRARVLQLTVVSKGSRILLNRGTARGVQKGWKGWLTDSRYKKHIRGTDFVISRVRKHRAMAYVPVGPDVVRRWARAVLVPPGKPALPGNNKCANFKPPCASDAQCGPGYQCVRKGCSPSQCSCNPSTGRVICTRDCSGGKCVRTTTKPGKRPIRRHR